MKIGIDLHGLSGVEQGSKTYICALTEAMLSTDNDNTYYLYVPRFLREIPASWIRPNVRIRRLWSKSRYIRLLAEFSLRTSFDGLDIIHCQYMPPLFTKCARILTIHDILHETRPEFYPSGLGKLMKMFYPLGARHAAVIITGSQFSKNEIERIYNVPSHKIKITPYAASKNCRKFEDISGFKHISDLYNLPEKYILYVGRLEPRKNIDGLIDAFAKLNNKASVKHKLVIAGAGDPLFPEYRKQLLRKARGQSIIFTGKIASEHLPLLYNCADIFVYPTYAEGFGLPVLEAMACGTAVITTKTSSIPEVTGDAAILTEPGNNNELACAIEKLLANPGHREQLSRKSLDQADNFSWENTARETLDIYRSEIESS